MHENDPCTGYPIGNFGIAAEVTPGGRIFPRMLYNPPVLGPWLEDLGCGQFSFSCDSVDLRDSEFEQVAVSRLYPEAVAAYSDPRMEGITIRAECFAPIKAGDAFIASLPVLCVEFELRNQSGRAKEVSVSFTLARAFDEEEEITLSDPGRFWLAGDETVHLGFDSAVRWKCVADRMCVGASKTVPPGGSETLRFVLLCYDGRGYYSSVCPDPSTLACYVSDHWEEFRRHRSEFISLLPRTHDEQIDRYLRWYVSAAILLTRITREHVLTMGYCELNQRDSFWTSWPHLVLWPDLERRMIEESASFQREDGKIPTTILPVIERDDDIDINEYFNLRVARYYEWTRDLEFARQTWPSLKSSIEYLLSTDRDGDGLLDQASFWGDWKDVCGVEGRRAAPHFELLWLAVLKSAQDMAQKLDDPEAESRFAELYRNSHDAVNRSVDQGGLWSGSFYTTLWHDGREDGHVQEDQLVGPLYGVVPQERVGSIYDAMQPGMTEWGMRDTYPYREQFSNSGGDYHNGGVWVFLNFADALSRFVSGYPDGACELLTRVGHWDLEKWGDYMPAEYLDGNTGENAGKPIQGWDACFYATVLFGILGTKVIGEAKVEIMPRIADTESFATPVTLPWGILHVSQSAASSRLQVTITSSATRKTSVRYGAMTAKAAPDSTSECIGECAFSVVEFDLDPGQSRELVFS